MRHDPFPRGTTRQISRRGAIGKIGAAAGVAVFAPSLAAEQAPATQGPTPNAARGVPPSVISTPPRDFTPGAGPVTYPDPDVITIDPAFATLRVNNTGIHRLFTGGCTTRDLRGALRGAISSGVTSRTTASCVGSRTTTGSRCSGSLRTTATAIRSTIRAADLMRASWPACRPIRARWLRHRDS